MSSCASFNRQEHVGLIATSCNRCILLLLAPLMPSENILALLQGGDRRSIGRSVKVVTIVSKNPRLFPKLIAGLWSADPLVRIRAADAAEKITRRNRELL